MNYKRIGLIIFSIASWALFLWGIFVIFLFFGALLSGSLDWPSWRFYIFGLMPLLFVFFIKNQLKIVFIKTRDFIIKNKSWFAHNWFRLGILLIVFISIISVIMISRSYLNQKTISENLKRFKEQEQTKLEYIAKRKRDCLDVYQAEQKNWNNTKGYEYDDKNDVCRVIYGANDEWKNIKCEEISPIKLGIKADSFLWENSFRRWTNCMDNIFDKEF